MFYTSVVFALTQLRLNFGEGCSMTVFAITYFLIDFYGVPLHNTVVSTSKAASPHEHAISCKVDNMQILNILGWLLFFLSFF